MFGANLDFFRVTILRASPVTPEFRDWATGISGVRELSPAQLSILALAKEGHGVGVALMRRFGLSATDARGALGQLLDLGVLLPRRARDDGSYRLSPGLPSVHAGLASGPGSGISGRVLTALAETEFATREELQQAVGAGRNGILKGAR